MVQFIQISVTAVFAAIVLKLAGVLTISWWWLLVPAGVYAGIVIMIAAALRMMANGGKLFGK